MILPRSPGVPETPERSRYRSHIQTCKDSTTPKSVLCPPARRETRSFGTCFKNHFPTSQNFKPHSLQEITSQWTTNHRLQEERSIPNTNCTSNILMDNQVFLMRLMDNLKREGGRKTIRKSLAVCVCVLLENQHLQFIYRDLFSIQGPANQCSTSKV